MAAQYKIIVCEGGDFGELCQDFIEDAWKIFFKICGVEDIEEACNVKRQELINEWEKEDLKNCMTRYNLNETTYARGLKELGPEFHLLEPEDKIRIGIVEGKRDPDNPNAVTQISFIKSPEGMMIPDVILVFLDVLKTEPMLEDKIKTLLYHEFIHACGDVKFNNPKIIDGHIRYDMVAVECVKELHENRVNTE